VDKIRERGMADGKRYTTIDEGRTPYVAEIGDQTITFTRALSANMELALTNRSDQSPDEAREFLTSVLAHMAPGHNGDLALLFDRLDSLAILTLIGDAAKALRVVPFTEAQGSSPPVANDGATGVGEPVSTTSTP